MRILHLEDDDYDAELIAQRLDAEGLDACITRVDTRATFENAVRGGDFDLILSDYALAGYNGAAALAFARQASPQTPFLFVSGALGEEVAVETLKSGATDYVLKARLDRLGSSIKRALRELEEKHRRIRAEEAVMESRELLALATEAANAWTWQMDLSSGVLVLPSKACLLHGLPESASALHLEQVAASVHPDDRTRFTEALARSQKEHCPLRADYRVCLPDGRICWIAARGSVFPGPHGLRLLGLIQDVTESKAAEEELRHSQAQLAAANAAKDRFLAVLSHELRTPLNPAMLVASELKDDPTVPEHARRELAGMQRNLELEARLIDDLLDLTRIANKKLQLEFLPVDLHQILKGTLEILKAELSAKQLRTEIQFAATDPVVAGDQPRLQQVFWNLLVNAIQFTPSEGSISIQTSDLGEKELLIEIKDSGIGISPAQLQEIFEPFHQSGDDSPGLGLGLTICRTLLGMHGGSISAMSTGRGQGALFRVTLPRTRLAPRPAPNRTQQSEPAPSSARILLVEDHMATASVLVRYLRRRGYTVEHAGTAAEAIAFCEQQPFDLLLTDLGLPDRSGVEVIREVKERWNIESVAVSGFGMESDVAATRAAGCRVHLIKPVSIQKLDEALRCMLSKPEHATASMELPE